MNYQSEDPYKHLPDEDKIRVQADMSKEDHSIIRSVIPSRGFLQVTVNTLLKGFIDELRELGITRYSPDNCDAYYRILRGRAALRTTSQAGDVDVKGGVNGTHQPSKNATDVPAGAQSEGGEGWGPGRAKGKRAKGGQAKLNVGA